MEQDYTYLTTIPDADLARKAAEIKTFLAEQDRKLTPAKDMLKAIETVLLDRMEQAELSVEEYGDVRLKRSVQVKYQLLKENSDTFYKWLVDTFKDADPSQMFSFFTSGVAQRAMSEFVEQNGFVPAGIKPNKVSSLTITKRK